MKRIFICALLTLCWASCMPDDAQTDATVADTSGDGDGTIDTFSVKRPQKLTQQQQKEIDSTKAELKELVNDASTIITEGSPEANDAVPGANGIVANPDQAPSFPGGQAAMDAYFKKKLVYPLVAFQNDITGNVLLKVVIENDGKIGGITVLKGLGYGCDESAADCVRTMPNWIPAKKKGAPVRTAITIPVFFGGDVEK